MNDNQHYLHDVLAGATIGISYGMGIYYRNQEKHDGAKITQLLLLPTEGESGWMLAMRGIF